MRKLIFFASLAIFSLNSFIAGSQSYSYNDQYNYIWTDPIYNICTGENMFVSGIEHDVIHGVYNPKTNTAKDTYNSNLLGMKAVGESGNAYVITGNYTDRYISNYDACSFSESFIENYSFKTAKSNNNYSLKIRFTYTVNFCTSEYTVKRDFFSEGCK